MGKNYNSNDYKVVLDIIYDSHIKHTGKWLANLGKTQYNLKKTQVRHICSSNPNNIENFINEDFLYYIDIYKVSLSSLYLEIMNRLKSELGFTIGGRIKNDDSILLKLHRKRFEDDGKFPLNKYLNDLLGFRIIDSNFEQNRDEVEQYIEKLKEHKWRLRHNYREIGKSYKGYHVYFMGAGSNYFPVELQIWDKKYERMNLESHEAYKKSYTYWPQIYKEG